MLNASGVQIAGSRQFLDRSNESLPSLNMNISNERCPDGENPHLHYVTLRGLHEYSPIMENLIRAYAMHLADPEHLVWDLLGEESDLSYSCRTSFNDFGSRILETMQN